MGARPFFAEDPSWAGTSKDRVQKIAAAQNNDRWICMLIPSSTFPRDPHAASRCSPGSRQYSKPATWHSNCRPVKFGLSGGREDLGNREVADDAVLLNLVDDNLIRLMRPRYVELHRLVDGAVSLLYPLVISQYVQSVSVPLWVCLPENEADRADALRLVSLFYIKLDIVAFSELPKRG